MFYQDEKERAFRFGDILKGFILSNAILENPLLDSKISDINYQIDIKFPQYCVLVTPCCSIGEKIISLTPLIHIMTDFFKNPFFKEDLTRINREMEPQESVSPEIWKGFDTNEQQKRIVKGKGYALYEYFIYEQNDLLPKYPIGEKTTGYYMIDFRNIFKVNCKKIPNAKQVPLEAKYLQLSIDARQELRDKIVSYFARKPAEDFATID